MALDAYRKKRSFKTTPEPKPEPPAAAARSAGPIFVVQKHAATRLHYDLRLEIDGALASWAVPQGPSLDPKVRRFAKRTEDHPLAYAAFEGRIPEGNYGAGEVIIWDRGTYVTLEADPAAAVARGELKFRLLGEKLRGGFMLKRLKDDDSNWILIKERDVEARPIDEYDVLRERPASLVSGRSIEARPPKRAAAKRKAPAVDASTITPGGIADAVEAPMPRRIAPQLATAADTPPSGPGWVHEIKYDGYRTLVFLQDGKARLITRNGLDWTERYGRLSPAFGKLAAHTAILDGEAVVQDAQGVPSLSLLEAALSERRTEAITFFAFDLLYLDGHDLTAAPLLARKGALAALLAPVIDARSAIQYSDHAEGDGAALFAEAARLGLEGVVSKRADAPYVQGRTKTWLKAKRVESGDFVVTGFSTNAPRCVSSLVLAEELPDGELRYRGRVGSGISEEQARALHARFEPHLIARPAAKPPDRIPGAQWIEPRFIATVGFRARSPDGTLRQTALYAVKDRRMPHNDQDRAPLAPQLVTDRDLAGIRLTNPEREMFESSGVTKLDVALYYAKVGDWMLPELLRRPVSLIRCPSGKRADCFFQRHAFNGLPAGVETIELAEEDGRGAYIWIKEPKGFLALCQFGAIEFHPWGCRIDDPECPDRLIFDLDPDEALPFSAVRDAAFALKARLERLGLTPFVRTTGGKGLHLVIALKAKQGWAEVKGFAEAFTRAAAADAPNTFVAVATKAKRKGKIFVDYLRNGRGATAIASFSLRARPEFTASVPLDWVELRTLTSGSVFDRISVPKRLALLVEDPWAGLHTSAGVISAKMRRDVGMKE